MSITQKTTAPPRLKYHPQAYRFLFSALRRAQKNLGRSQADGPDDEHAHISGQELLEGARELAQEQFGLMALAVFHAWGLRATDDVGRMVFELIERGEMRKTEHDQISDFHDVFDFEEVFNRQCPLDVSRAFR